MLNPSGARHFTVAIQAEPGCEDRIPSLSTARKNRSHPGTNGTMSNDESTLTLDDRRMPDLDTGDIRNRIVRAMLTSELNTKGPSVWNLLPLSHTSHEH